MTNTDQKNGLALVLIVDGKQVGSNFMPLPETYSQADTGLQALMTSARDALARVYEDKAAQHVEALNFEIARLTAELAKQAEASP